MSEGWTNLPNGVQSFQQEHESKVICTLINELNGMFNLDLGKEPGFDRMSDNAPVADRPRILLIGSSHVVREGEILADRGYEVTLVSKPGWRATKGAVDEMVEKVKEALVNMSPHDVVVVQLLDNTSYLARSDELCGRRLPHRGGPRPRGEGPAVHDFSESGAIATSLGRLEGVSSDADAKIPPRSLL